MAVVAGRTVIAGRAGRVEGQAVKIKKVKIVTCFLLLPVGLDMLVVSQYYPEERHLLSHSQSHQIL